MCTWHNVLRLCVWSNLNCRALLVNDQFRSRLQHMSVQVPVGVSPYFRHSSRPYLAQHGVAVHNRQQSSESLLFIDKYPNSWSKIKRNMRSFAHEYFTAWEATNWGLAFSVKCSWDKTHGAKKSFTRKFKHVFYSMVSIVMTQYPRSSISAAS